MRILYHHRTLAKDGQAVHIEEMVAALGRAGHEVLVVGPPAEGRENLARLRGRLPKWAAEMGELAYSVPVLRRLVAAASSFRPHVFYERATLFCPAGKLFSMGSAIPWLLEINSPLAEERARHGGLAMPGLARWSEAWAWRGADAVLPVSEVLAGHVERAGVPRRRIHVIPNGVDRARFHPGRDGGPVRRRLGLGDEMVVLGFSGFVRDWHGLPMVLDVMARLGGERRLHLLVVGEGPALDDIMAHAVRLGLGGRVSLAGRVGRECLPDHLAAFDIALQPRAVAYASPLKLIEYMAMGRAIVAPDQPNIREVLSDGADALLFAPEDAAALEAAIARLADDPGLRMRLGQAASEAVDRRGLTWDSNAARVGAIAAPLAAVRRAG